MPIAFERCPYCDAEQEIEIDGIPESDEQEFECENCHKKFKFYWEASIDIYTYKNDK